jgi:NADP-dependent 3-hydroxy acid dehydrogenase YdfG
MSCGRCPKNCAPGNEALQIHTTVISPDAMVTELPNSTMKPDTAEKVRKAHEIAIPTDMFARAVAFAVNQPQDVDVNEILFRPTRQELYLPAAQYTPGGSSTRWTRLSRSREGSL